MKRINKYFPVSFIICACFMTAAYSWSQDIKPLPQLTPVPQLPSATTFLPVNPLDKVIDDVVISTAPVQSAPPEQQPGQTIQDRLNKSQQKRQDLLDKSNAPHQKILDRINESQQKRQDMLDRSNEPHQKIQDKIDKNLKEQQDKLDQSHSIN